MTVVRPAMMYGAETWAVKKAQEKLDVAEMRMLRWTSGVTKLNIITNERIGGAAKVGEIFKKMQESRLKWYGPVLRRDEQYNDGQESDGDGGVGKKQERKTKAEVVGQHHGRLVGERIVRRGSARPI